MLVRMWGTLLAMFMGRYSLSLFCHLPLPFNMLIDTATTIMTMLGSISDVSVTPGIWQ